VAVCSQELAQLNQPHTTLDFVYSTAAQLNFEAAYASAQGRRSVTTSAQDSASSADASDAADAGGAAAAGRRRAELMVEQRVRMRSLLLERLFDAMREMVPEESTLRAFLAVLITLMAEPSEITGRSRGVTLLLSDA
jgi:hypothetical protein